MTPEQQKDLFQPFMQADSSITRKYGGTGLGLHISYKLAQLMGGNIHVTSEQEKGSTFFCTIPLSLVDPIQEHTEEKESIPNLPKGHILVVEDDPVNRVFLEELLTSLGQTFEMVSNGIQAIRCCELNSYDAIFMDYQMPEMDGLTATKEIRKSINTPIIALSALIDKDIKQEWNNAGINTFLSKPIEIKMVEKALVKYLPKENDEE